MAQEIVLSLPEPPSANVYYRRGFKGAPHESSEAKAYKEAVGMLTSRYRTGNQVPFPSEDVTISIVWHRSCRRGDLSNRIKILEDALEGMMYRNDKQIVQLWARRVDEHDQIPKGFMRVAISDHGIVARSSRSPTPTSPRRKARPRGARSVSPADTIPNASD